MKQTRIHGDQNNYVTFSIPKSEDDPIEKMRIVRNKMADSRRKEEQRIIQDAILIRNRVNKPATVKGQKVTYATDVDRNLVQDEDELVLVGADVVFLYPSMTDIELANLCYEAINGIKNQVL